MPRVSEGLNSPRKGPITLAEAVVAKFQANMLKNVNIGIDLNRNEGYGFKLWLEVKWVKREALLISACLFQSGWERTWCSHPDFRDPSKPACRKMRRSARRWCHPRRQQHQFARCQAQGGCHDFVAAGDSTFLTQEHCATPGRVSQHAGSACLFQRGQIEFEVVYVAPEVDSDDENVEYEDDNGHHYRLYLDELDSSCAAPAGNSSASLQGK